MLDFLGGGIIVMKVARYPLTQERQDKLNALQDIFKTGVTTKTIDKALELAFKYLKYLEKEKNKLAERQKEILNDYEF